MISHAIARHRRALSRSIDTITLSGVLLALTAAGALAAGATPGRYAGRTAQHGTATLTVGAGAIRTAQIGWTARCAGSGQTVHNTTTFARVSVRGGRFATRTTSAQTISGGYRARFAESAVGRFAGRRVSGSFAGTMRVYQASSGRLVDSCASGAVAFSAVRG